MAVAVALALMALCAAAYTPPPWGDGGWRRCEDVAGCPEAAEAMHQQWGIAPEECDFATVRAEDLDAATFLRDFVDKQRPVRIVGTFDREAGAPGWRDLFASRLTREALRRFHGDEAASVAGSPDAVPLRRYLNDMAGDAAFAEGYPKTVWQGGLAGDLPDPPTGDLVAPVVGSRLEWPAYWRGLCAGPAQCSHTAAWLILSPPLGGAPFHRHRDVLHVEAYGQKVWFLSWDPEDAARLDRERGDVDAVADHPLVRLRDWAADAGNRRVIRNSLKCTQSAGDVLYLPPWLHHSTLSLTDTISLSYPVGQQQDGAMPPPLTAPDVRSGEL